ncbi:MAG: hypothetical protein AAF827_00960 [Cyanobacteria bacterium P01_D01_bin.6]
MTATLAALRWVAIPALASATVARLLLASTALTFTPVGFRLGGCG